MPTGLRIRGLPRARLSEENMRCNSCKKKIENENLFRCPHCGKPIVKKKKKDSKELIGTIAFLAVSGAYAIINFAGFFFKCDYYNMAALLIALIVYVMAVPFIVGNYQGVSRSAADIIAAVISVPFIANWFAASFKNISTLTVDGLSTAYYFSVPAVLIIVDLILVFKAAGIVSDGKNIKWICLALGAAEFVFTAVFYSITKEVKTLAILVMGINAFLPAFAAYHVISRDGRA